MKHSTKLEITSRQAEAILEQWLKQPVSCRGIKRLLGGELHSVFALEFNRDPCKAVIKLRIPEDDGFDGEKDRLEYLGKKGIPVPEVFDVGAPGDLNPFSYILLEHLPGMTLDSAELARDERSDVERALAEHVLKLHANTRDVFGEICGHFATRQWSDIVVPRLIDMRDEMQGRLPEKVLNQITVAVDAAEDVFSQSQSAPTLIHGDLWSGNIMINKKNGRWQISGFIDPGTQYADVEHELAYLQCFDTVGKDFFEAYTAHTPMRPGFELRKLFYWLNTQMIHVWLFDTQEYKGNTTRLANEIARKLIGERHE